MCSSRATVGNGEHAFVQRKSTPAPSNKGGWPMDVNTFAQLFSNLGIPVACLCVTFYLWYTETQNHKEEMNKMTDAVNNNTLILQRLLDKLGEDETT